MADHVWIIGQYSWIRPNLQQQTGLWMSHTIHVSYIARGYSISLWVIYWQEKNCQRSKISSALEKYL